MALLTPADPRHYRVDLEYFKESVPNPGDLEAQGPNSYHTAAVPENSSLSTRPQCPFLSVHYSPRKGLNPIDISLSPPMKAALEEQRYRDRDWARKSFPSGKRGSVTRGRMSQMLVGS